MAAAAAAPSTIPLETKSFLFGLVMRGCQWDLERCAITEDWFKFWEHAWAPRGIDFFSRLFKQVLVLYLSSQHQYTVLAQAGTADFFTRGSCLVFDFGATKQY
jgi:hypothetical protein